MRSSAATTDGWRGLPGPDWSEFDLLATIGHAAASGVLGPSVLIGYDGRAGARELAQLAADLLSNRGLSCHLATGPSPTPALGRLVHHRPDLTSAIIITASHNPPGFIGVKLRDARGQGIRWPHHPDPAIATITELPNHRQSHPAIDACALYADTVGHALLAAASRFDGQLIIDAAHGALGALAPHLPSLSWHRARPLPFFAGHTPDPALRPQADTLAAGLLERATDPERTMIAMVDGDGDRLALYTARSGYIGSGEQAAALLTAGLPARRLITTVVAPRMTVLMAQRHQPCLTLTQTEIGFKHIVTAWGEEPHQPTLGFEPNGALVWTQHGDDYFERDSLAALSTVLTQLRTITTLDDAIAMLRRDHPYPQRLVTVTHPIQVVLDRLRHALPPTWRRDQASAGLVVFQHDPYGHIAVRTSGTEAATRLYIEAPVQILERLTSALAEPCPAIGRLSTQE